ncbi:response regulator transcription factor [Saccharospirillum salsuginis]|uniref:DNA-binding response regulator n=1 Tax=Saccharospirillum salsuginis TaxID=418750 RepID=A0A918KTH2_9GAMM|nr:response regulator [Saccharospirillum salsuginis]GGX75383.1 DNA-binding response regulator [Saccharospirillum salsuginis]
MKEPAELLTVHLIDDDDSFRESTAWLLEASDLEVVDHASPGDFLGELEQKGPAGQVGCVVTDLRMPEMNGFELMDELRKRHLSMPVVMITGHGDVPVAVEAMKMGAANFIEKPFDGTVLVETVRQAMREPGAKLRNPEATRERLDKLSPRERQVLDLVCAGKLNKTIADVLGISIKTVELHRANMQSKLGARNVQELVRLTLGYE